MTLKSHYQYDRRPLSYQLYVIMFTLPSKLKLCFPISDFSTLIWNKLNYVFQISDFSTFPLQNQVL